MWKRRWNCHSSRDESHRPPCTLIRYQNGSICRVSRPREFRWTLKNEILRRETNRKRGTKFSNREVSFGRKIESKKKKWRTRAIFSLRENGSLFVYSFAWKHRVRGTSCMVTDTRGRNCRKIFNVSLLNKRIRICVLLYRKRLGSRQWPSSTVLLLSVSPQSNDSCDSTSAILKGNSFRDIKKALPGCCCIGPFARCFTR